MKHTVDVKILMVYMLLAVIALAFVVGVLPELRFYAANPGVRPFDLGESYLGKAQSFIGINNMSLRQCVGDAVSRRTEGKGGAK